MQIFVSPYLYTRLSQVGKRPERAKAYSPGQRPGYRVRKKIRPASYDFIQTYLVNIL